MTAKCQGLFGLIFGHKFEAYYDEEETLPPIGRFKAENFAESLKVLKDHKQTYRESVCRRCGVIATPKEAP